MPSELDPTHTLVSDGDVASFKKLLERVVPAASAALVRLQYDELDVEPDGEACRRTWETVRPRFQRVPAEDDERNGTRAWQCPLETEADRAALFDLVALTEGMVGSYFVVALELRVDDGPVLEAVPHHSNASVDATTLDAALEDAAEDLGIAGGEVVALDCEGACLVPVETGLEWEAGERTWRLAGGSLCVETLDGRKASCYGLSNLERVTVADDSTTLELAWEAGDLPDDLVGRALGWVMDRLYDPPTRVPCGTSDRAASVRAHLIDVLEAVSARDC